MMNCGVDLPYETLLRPINQVNKPTFLLQDCVERRKCVWQTSEKDGEQPKQPGGKIGTKIFVMNQIGQFIY